MDKNIKHGIWGLINNLLDTMHKRRTVLIALSCIVVFITTYILILPAFTLEKDKAAEQGGIDVSSVEATSDSDSEAEVYTADTDEEDMSAADDDIENAGDAYSSDETIADEDADIEDDGSDMPAADGDTEISDDADADVDTGAADADDEEMQEEETSAPAEGLLIYEGDGYTVSVEDPDSVLPADTELVVEDILENPVDGTRAERKAMEEAYRDYCEQAITAINDEAGDKEIKAISFARFYDIRFMSSGEEITPDKPVNVTITYDKNASMDLRVKETDDVRIVHFAQDDKTEEVTAELLDRKTVDVTLEKSRMTETTFEAESFSVYAVVYTVVLEDEVLTASGDKYKVTVSYGEDADIPDGAELRVKEITEKDREYTRLQRDIADNLQDGTDSIPAHPMLLDISIWADGKEIEPAEGSEVKVEVTLVSSTLKGMYSDEESPVLINDEPVSEEAGNADKSIRVIHQVEEGRLEVMDTTDVISEEALVSEFTTDSFSNWLVYLDEDLTDIDLTTSDTLTLRPYSEWVWKSTDELDEYQGGQWTFPDSAWNIEERDEDVQTGTDWWGRPIYETIHFTYYTHKTNGSQFRSFEKTDGELNETYTVVTSVSLSETNGGFDIQTNKGKTIHVHVTQGQSSPKPSTVQGIPGLKVNLFDYDVPYPQGQSSGYDFTRSGNLDVSSNTAANPDNTSVNSPYNNKARDFKFLGWGSNDSSDQEWCWINNYTHDDPNQGIVKQHLGSDGYPELEVSKSGWEHGNMSLGYLFDTSSKNNSVYAFPGAGGLFQQDNQGYYYYNSNTNYAEYDRDSNSFILYSHTYSQNTGGSNGANAKPIGFLPFHDYDTSNTQPSMNHNQALNHHFGMSMEVDFEIPKDRQMEDQIGNKHDIIYEFSGDDDLWVFVDDVLVLDIGGIHQPVTGSINFTTGEIKVHGVDDITRTFDVGGHTLKMFYLERGGCDSNLSVRFNLPLTVANAGFSVNKKSAADGGPDSDIVLPNAQFGIWENPDCEGEPYKTATSGSDGKVDFGELPVREEGQKFYLKEIKAPDGYLTSKKIYTLTAVKGNGNDYYFTVSDGEQSLGQEPVIRNAKPVPIDLSLHKEWQDAAGSATDTSSVQAEFELKRYKTYTKVTPQDPIPSGVTTVRAGRVQPSGSWQTTVLDTASIKRGTNATITWSYPSNYNGQRQYRYSTNGGDSGGSWNYSAQNLNRNGSAQIQVPASGELWVYFYDEWNSAVSVSISGAPDQTEQDPIEEVVTEPDDDFSQTVTLPRSGSYDYTFEDLPVQVVDGGVVYDYTYYIVEKTVPAGYEAVYVDGNGKVISDPSVLSTNEDGTQTIINRKLLDVPVEKYWPDYSGDEYTWTATFVLEQMEVKVNEDDPDAGDAIDDWAPVAGRDPLVVSKDQDPLPMFTNLPMYRVHSNGTRYRILYSVEEVAYQVKEDGTVIEEWESDGPGSHGNYTPQFVQDAGANGSDISNYKIILINTIAEYTATREIDLDIEKTWPADTDYAADEDAYARFVLKRYVHEEYRRYPNVTQDTEWVTVTLLTSSTAQEEGSRRQTLVVPKDTTLHIIGKVRGSTNANKIVFSQDSGQDNIELIRDNTGSSDPSPFDLTVIADQTKTISLTQGDNFVVGGRDGFRFSDYYNKTEDRLDQGFEEHFTLDSENDWQWLFRYLSVIEESDTDPTVADQTMYVYSYFFEEVGCNPEDYEPTFKDSYGNILGDGSHRVDFSTDITAENDKKTGVLRITKSVTVDGDPADALSAGRKTLADGTYTFRVFEADGTTRAKQAGSTAPLDDITITISNGVSGSADVTGLYVGDYVIKEIGSDNPNVSLDTEGHSVTVTAGQTASAGATASITNNYVTTGITVQKEWQKSDGSADTAKTGIITFTLIQTAYTYDADTGDEIEEIESEVTAYHGKYTLQIGDAAAQFINDQPGITFSSETIAAVSDLPLYGSVSGTPVKYHYYVREAGIDGYTGIETQDGEGNWTLVNRPAADTDRDTEHTVTKLWKDKDGNTATLTGDETIEFVIKQKAVKTDYVPVTIHLYDPNFTTEANSKTIYVKKGTDFSYTVDEYTLIFLTSHYVNVSVNGETAVRLSNGSSRSITVTGPTSIVASIQNSWPSSVGSWASNPWTGDATGLYIWTFDYSDTPDKIETIDELIARYAAETDGVTTSEFRYEMSRNSISAVTDEIGTVTAANFVASFTELPLFKQVGDDSYTYYYTVSEIRVNGAEVVNGQTEDYVVSYEGSTDAATVITNTEKEKISVSADKTWTNADETHTPPEGAAVTFELYRDGEATGKTVVLNGKIDVADDEDVISEDTHEKNAEAIAANAYESAAWTAVWDKLNKYQDDGTTLHVYTIREVAGYTGYATASGSAAAGGTINNEQISTALDILKVDSADPGITLEGAQFTIRRIKDTLGASNVAYDGEESSPVPTDADGQARIEGITYGYYEVREKHSPEGYNLPGDACFYIRYDENGLRLLEKDLTKDPKDWDASKTVVGHVTLTGGTAEVKNESGVILPHTGGAGTVFFYLAGAMLVIGAGAMLLRRRLLSR